MAKAIDKSYDLNTWGLNDALMTHTLQVRAMENLLDCAQRLKYKGPNKNLLNELEVLKQIRDQTWDDVKEFTAGKGYHKWQKYLLQVQTKVDPVIAANNEQADREISKGNKQLELIDHFMDQLTIDIEKHTVIFNEMVPWLDARFGTTIWQEKPKGMTIKQY